MLFLLFVGGTILLPAFHRLHCADNDATHEAANCPVCQVTNTPVITAHSGIAPVAECVAADSIDTQVGDLPSASRREPTQARAPPVA